MSIWISLYQIINYEKLILKTFTNRIIMKTQIVYKLRRKHIKLFFIHLPAATDHSVVEKCVSECLPAILRGR